MDIHINMSIKMDSFDATVEVINTRTRFPFRISIRFRLFNVWKESEDLSKTGELTILLKETSRDGGEGKMLKKTQIDTVWSM